MHSLQKSPGSAFFSFTIDVQKTDRQREREGRKNGSVGFLILWAQVQSKERHLSPETRIDSLFVAVTTKESSWKREGTVSAWTNINRNNIEFLENMRCILVKGMISTPKIYQCLQGVGFTALLKSQRLKRSINTFLYKYILDLYYWVFTIHSFPPSHNRQFVKLSIANLSFSAPFFPLSLFFSLSSWWCTGAGRL